MEVYTARVRSPGGIALCGVSQKVQKYQVYAQYDVVVHIITQEMYAHHAECTHFPRKTLDKYATAAYGRMMLRI